MSDRLAARLESQNHRAPSGSSSFSNFACHLHPEVMYCNHMYVRTWLIRVVFACVCAHVAFEQYLAAYVALSGGFGWLAHSCS